MARTQYSEVVTFVESDTLKPASNARVSVYLPGTTTLVTIYTTRTAGTTKSNPFTTASDGAAEFWAEWGDYDIKYEDLNVPARFGTKTFGWSSTSGSNAAIPLAAEGAAINRQYAPIGAVIDWWRPNNTVTIPTGWAECNGQTIASGDHDFATGASITLPDLRGVFVIGANSALADGAAASAGDAAANAPGIRGIGGSHSRSLQHSHTINDHTHAGTTSTNGAHTHGILTSGISSMFFGPKGYGGATEPGGTSAVDHTHGGSTGSAGDHTHTMTTGGASNRGTDSQLGTAQDIKPRYIGLLKIMKIKRN